MAAADITGNGISTHAFLFSPHDATGQTAKRIAKGALAFRRITDPRDQKIVIDQLISKATKKIRIGNSHDIRWPPREVFRFD